MRLLDRLRIFESFRRLVSSSEFEGSGIGLATAKKIIERHHGTIEAHGKEGEGAAIMVAFRIHENGAAAVAEDGS